MLRRRLIEDYVSKVLKRSGDFVAAADFCEATPAVRDDLLSTYARTRETESIERVVEIQARIDAYSARVAMLSDRGTRSGRRAILEDFCRATIVSQRGFRDMTDVILDESGLGAAIAKWADVEINTATIVQRDLAKERDQAQAIADDFKSGVE